MGSGTSGAYQGTSGLQSARNQVEEMGSSLENVRHPTSLAPNKTASAPKASSSSTTQNKLADSVSQPDSLTTLERNALAMEGRFAMNENGHFGRKSKGARTIESEDPVADSISFYKQLGRDGTVEPLKGKSEGTFTRMPEGDWMTHRVVTRTPKVLPLRYGCRRRIW